MSWESKHICSNCEGARHVPETSSNTQEATLIAVIPWEVTRECDAQTFRAVVELFLKLIEMMIYSGWVVSTEYNAEIHDADYDWSIQLCLCLLMLKDSVKDITWVLKPAVSFNPWENVAHYLKKQTFEPHTYQVSNMNLVKPTCFVVSDSCCSILSTTFLKGGLLKGSASQQDRMIWYLNSSRGTEQLIPQNFFFRPLWYNNYKTFFATSCIVNRKVRLETWEDTVCSDQSKTQAFLCHHWKETTFWFLMFPKRASFICLW